MEKRGVIDGENTPPGEGHCCGGKCGQPQTKEAADKLEDSTSTRAAQHAEEQSSK